MENGNGVENLSKDLASRLIEIFESQIESDDPKTGGSILDFDEELKNYAQKLAKNLKFFNSESENHIPDSKSVTSSENSSYRSKFHPFPTLEPIQECDEDFASNGEHLEISKSQFFETEISEELNRAKLFIFDDDSSELVKLVNERLIHPNDISLENGDSDVAETKDFVQRYLFHYACEIDSIKCAKCIAEDINHWNSSQVNFRNAKGWTALHCAANSGSIECLNFLLQHEADVDDPFVPQNSPLEVAIINSCSLINTKLQDSWSSEMTIDEFLKYFQDVDLSVVRLLSNKSTKLVDLAFNFASDGNLIALVVLLTINGHSLVNSCNPNLDKHNTLTDYLVNLAILSREKDIFKCKEESTIFWSDRELILKEVESVLLWKPNLEGKSWLGKAYAPPLVKAAEVKDEELLSLLINAGAPINASDFDGDTPLHACILSENDSINSSKIVYKLVKNNAKVSMFNKLEITPLHIAAERGQLDSAKILLMMDPSLIHSMNLLKETPLHLAVRNNHIECAKLFMFYGSNRALNDLRKQSPLDLATSSEMKEVLLRPHFSERGKETICSSLNESQQSDLQNLAMFQKKTFSPTKKFSLTHLSPFPKTELCRYFLMAGGCIRGDSCLFAHGEAELQTKTNLIQENRPMSPGMPLSDQKLAEESFKKIFVGGLAPNVDSDYLHEYFTRFGPIEDATVVGVQAGNKVQSRGFGFVTFKHEGSAEAAVKDRFLFIAGKKVEVKGAIPKSATQSEYSQNDNPSVSGSVSSPALALASFIDQLPSFPSVFPPRPIIHSPDKPKMFPIPYSSPTEKLSFPPMQTPHSPIVGNAFLSKPLTDSSHPFWLVKLREWLPNFLLSVSSRLAEGEWYPLSSLKGDFRATCGLEMDHVALGYLKLSDFVRSLSDVCRMKVVPVGRGPATHMVLLPPIKKNMNRMIPPPSRPIPPPNIQFNNPSAFLGNRSYASAIMGIQKNVSQDHSMASLPFSAQGYRQSMSPNKEFAATVASNAISNSNATYSPGGYGQISETESFSSPQYLTAKSRFNEECLSPESENVKVSLLESFNLVESRENIQPSPSTSPTDKGKSKSKSDEEEEEDEDDSHDFDSPEELFKLISMLQIQDESFSDHPELKEKEMEKSTISSEFKFSNDRLKDSMYLPDSSPITPPVEEKKFIISPRASISPNPPIGGHEVGSAIHLPSQSTDMSSSSSLDTYEGTNVIWSSQFPNFALAQSQGVLERMATNFFFPHLPPSSTPSELPPPVSSTSSMYILESQKDREHFMDAFPDQRNRSMRFPVYAGFGASIHGGESFTPLTRPSAMDSDESYLRDWQGVQNPPPILPYNVYDFQQIPFPFLPPLRANVPAGMASAATVVPPNLNMNMNVNMNVNSLPFTCVICNHRRSQWFCVPCGHTPICTICRDAIYAQGINLMICPLCKQNVDQIYPLP